jgi:hypothetical protein
MSICISFRKYIFEFVKKNFKKTLTDLKCNFDNEMTQFRLNITFGLEKRPSLFYRYLQ